MPKTMKRYELNHQQDLVVVAFIEGRISGASAARRIKLPHRQGFVNMFASIIQQWHRDGLIEVKFGKKTPDKK